MREFRLTCLAVAAIVAALPLTAAAADFKIATIRSLELLRDAPQISSANEKMKSEFEKRQKSLQAEGKKLADDIKSFQREADTLSPAQRANTEKELNTRKIDFEFKQRELAEQVGNREQELRRDLEAKFSEAIREVAKEQGIDLVLQDPVYASPDVDITDEVLKRLGGSGKK